MVFPFLPLGSLIHSYPLSTLGVKHREGPLEVPPPCQTRKEEWEIEGEKEETKREEEREEVEEEEEVKEERMREKKREKGHCLPFAKKSFKKTAFFDILKNPQNIQGLLRKKETKNKKKRKERKF